MISLSKMRFKQNRRLGDSNMQAMRIFGSQYVSIGYTTAKGPNCFVGNYKGDGVNTWEICYGPVAGDPAKCQVVSFASQQRVNTILRNVSLKGRMEAADA